MSLVCSISAFPTQTTPGTPVAFICLVKNNGASTVFVTSLEPTVKRPGGVVQHAAMDLGRVPLGPGFDTSIAPGGGEKPFRFGGFVGAPSGGDGGPNPGTVSYEVGAIVQSSNGSTAYAQPATVTSVPYDARLRTGTGSYGPGVSQVTLPSIPDLPAFPDQFGAFQFNYFADSAYMPVVL